MVITCNYCRHEFTLDDSKVPSGTFKLKCPKCSKLITAQKEAAPAVTSAVPPSGEMTPDLQTVPVSIQAYIKRELEAVKKEILDSIRGSSQEGSPKSQTAPDTIFTVEKAEHAALICDGDSSSVDWISKALRQLGYHLDMAQTVVDAKKKIETYSYSLVTVSSSLLDDMEGGRKVIARLNGLKPAQRRKIFVVLVSDNVTSADGSAAFFSGTNLVINKADLPKLATLIQDGLRKVKQLYSFFDRVTAEKSKGL